ncbi:dipeptidyl-peptidase-4 [Motilibacter peucedani]|uniref:Dipeptidyl-peptidase-4 n=1 Tax=Motilibacter peucedani TaxID=598650 RepID=A0A420XMB0_9ACTN|nr:prolyl oligopeptidase family serine peptidase [Motilibacter peucedani]RKS72417.1 dipeptidyl-peptidase-4 [Motilibacter peucedani]
MSDVDSFPRLSARTQRFRLGAPRDLTVSEDGTRVAFVRSGGPTDRVGRLWTLDVATGAETLVVDPAALLGGDEEDLPPEERARRERLREGAGGVTAYAVSRSGSTAALALGGRVVVADLEDGTAALVECPGPAIDPRPSPDGSLVSYVVGGALHVVDPATGADRVLAEPDGDDVTWGLADFVAAEEMHRYRGAWWSPASDAVLAARVDESPVQSWWIADPARPGTEPHRVRYPAAGTPNALVGLELLRLDGTRTEVAWDAGAFPYLAAVTWTLHEPVLLVQSRDQRRTQTLAVDPATGATRLLREDSDEHWVELVPGTPAQLPDGRLVHTLDDGDTRRLAVEGRPVTPLGLQVESVAQADEQGVLFRATEDAVHVAVWKWDAASGAVAPLSPRTGLHGARRSGGTTVLSSMGLEEAGTRVTVTATGGTGVPVSSLAAEPPFAAAPVALLRAGEHQLRTAVVLPRDRDRFPGRLPVVMDPYGGPGHREVAGAQAAWLEPQWLADQGFAVVVADGRGTPGRGPRFEREIAGGRWAQTVLDDQVAALEAAAEAHPDDLDASRVGIRGWSFGGYLAALAVLRRPDVFAAAVAGAPVTDWSLYDTHYTERYLGTPEEHPDWYAANSLLDDAGALTRPLLLVHGLSDDNVVVAHTLRLSSALLAAGRAHTVLPLSGVTHMTPQEVVAENLTLLQVEFLQQHLAH